MKAARPFAGTSVLVWVVWVHGVAFVEDGGSIRVVRTFVSPIRLSTLSTFLRLFDRPRAWYKTPITEERGSLESIYLMGGEALDERAERVHLEEISSAHEIEGCHLRFHA